jgi:hypothetical protein
MKKSEWFGVKLLHKMEITGEPDADRIDEFYYETKTFFEESILLVSASSFDEAYQIAEAKARENNGVYENKYGQMIQQEFYESIDCFHLFGSPESGEEIYSTFFHKEQDEDVDTLLHKRYDSSCVEKKHLLRHK